MKLPLGTPLAGIAGIGPAVLKRLSKLGIITVQDMLWHFPVRYEDFSQIYKIADLEPGMQATIQGRVMSIKIRRSWKRHLIIVEAIIADETGDIRATWFNQPYLLNVLGRGRTANFAGKVSVNDDGIFLSHPSFELVRAAPTKTLQETKHTGRLVPIYSETKGLTSKWLRALVQPILKNAEGPEEWIPTEILTEQNLPEINEALRLIHFPEEMVDAELARKRFAFEDLFLLQILNFQLKEKMATENAAPLQIEIEHFKKILGELPFELTPSQKTSVWEIMQDIAKPHPMNRLLQGDVGSGKTVIAALTAIIAAHNQFQTAIMAPTEVLAAQHYETFKKLLGGIKTIHQPIVGLLTGSAAKIFYENDLETETKKTALLKKIASGEAQIVIGTHALIQKTVGFKSLGLVVVDEQHRFGTQQRAFLLKNSLNAQIPNSLALRDLATPDKFQIPHLLSMSATPIPRTLMLTVFGDLDVSLITELPKGRRSIITSIVLPAEKNKAHDFIRSEVKNGRQAFVVCPRIEQSTNSESSPNLRIKTLQALEIKSVKEEYEKLSKQIFPDLKIAMLHGKMRSYEKTKIMQDFKDRKFDILVATSVIEVGVDVPNATIIAIEGADRFGLAQLYQMRGRVGRGEHQSHCFLLTGSSSQNTAARLKAILSAKNGFELAEEDLRLRGPGQFFGEKQTGLPDIAMQSLQDMSLVKFSKDAAEAILKKDPQLQRNPLLRQKLDEFKARIHME